MADVDTNATPPTEPDPGAEPNEPTEPTEPQSTEPIEPTEPVEPIPLTPDQIVEKSNQMMQSWLGRRDADLLQRIGQQIDQKIGAIQPSGDPIDYGQKILDDPKGVINEVLTDRERVGMAFNQQVINTAAQIMDNDVLFKDAELGKEVVEDIRVNFGQVNRNLPPQYAADLLVKTAVANVYRKREGTKTNPLAGNTPATGPLGTVTPPNAATTKVKIPKISSMAKELATKFGYKEKDLARVFGEEK